MPDSIVARRAYLVIVSVRRVGFRVRFCQRAGPRLGLYLVGGGHVIEHGPLPMKNR